MKECCRQIKKKSNIAIVTKLSPEILQTQYAARGQLLAMAILYYRATQLQYLTAEWTAYPYHLHYAPETRSWEVGLFPVTKKWTKWRSLSGTAVQTAAMASFVYSCTGQKTRYQPEHLGILNLFLFFELSWQISGQQLL